MSKERTLEVSVKWNGTETDFRGNVEEVSTAFLKFLCERLPALEVISRIVVTLDVEKILQSLDGLVFIAKEGTMLSPETKPTSREAVILCLVAQYAGFKMGILKRDALRPLEIEKITGEKSGSVTGRLSELSEKRLVESSQEREYRITTLGIKFFVDEVSAKLKPKQD
jgi:uncharacterized protein YjhX (UPF0386 family)